MRLCETSVPVGSADRLPLAAPLLVDTAQVWPGEQRDVAKPPIINDDEIAAPTSKLLKRKHRCKRNKTLSLFSQNS